ncbi:MAG: rhodanese-like domain-containing protein [Lewinellaceae bacterium]|nr:rhodanese-like domain-containing protein [Saprospiraceae bacterium]MCB0544027.1 rhodanese-like domain-containing protein [Saprospiraceae bacterium]MCB9306254.1 rhodanese-like domain-containing protein [Lewinellaceae bacterium]MCB9354923.1 rhodanese-like domain-containing protein [Lewinellaceae bacterium]
MTMFKKLTPREAYAAYILGSLIVDVRDHSAGDSKNLDVRQVVALPLSELDQRLNELPSNRPVVLLSNIGIRGKEAARMLVERGYQDVSIVTGGIKAWEQEGLPVK